MSWIRQKEMGKGTKTCKNQGNSVYCQVFCVVAFIDPVLNKIIFLKKKNNFSCCFRKVNF